MIPNNLKYILREFNRQKSYVFINFVGLTIGLATTLLIGKYVLNEWKADVFIPHPERTFRLLRISEINNEPYRIGVTSAPFATAIQQDYPDDIETTCRVLNGNSLVTIGDKNFEEEKYGYVDPNFVTFFNLPLLHGDPNTVLSEEHRIILSKKTAEKYFGTTAAAFGKTLKIDNDYNAIVSGVFDDPAYQSHLDFDLVESNQLLYNAHYWTEWWSNSFVTYVRLNPKVSAHNFNSRLPDFMEKYFGDDFKKSGTKIGLEIEPILDTYFAAATRYDPVQHGNRSGTLIFLFASILLIVVASINYINLSTATAITRSKEMAIHKILGSGKSVIIKRMMLESALLTSIALIAALQLVYFAMPWFENIMETTFHYQLDFWQIALLIIGLGLVVSVGSGLYPGMLMASFQAKDALKGNRMSGNQQTGRLRKGLVIFQYTLSTVLLCSTFVIQQQLNYLNHKDLGFNKDDLLVVNINNPDVRRQRGAFVNSLLQEPGVKEISFMSGIPGGFHDATSIDLPAIQKSLRMRTAFVDFNFVQTLGMEVVAGRNLNGKLASDTTHAVLLNEQAVADIGIRPEEVLGQTLYMTSFDSIPKTVVGVLKNYHFTSLHDKIEPLIISYSDRAGVLAIRSESHKISASIAAVEKAWMEIAPGYPLNYSFLDQRLQTQYSNELKQGRLFAFFAVIAISIACLGIFGLAAFSTSTRKKEIGIRKVLGASILGIVGLLSRDFLKLVILSCFLAIPFAWFLMDNWLEHFAYKIQITGWVFFLAGLIGLLISLATVSVHSVRAAVANPVESLKDE